MTLPSGPPAGADVVVPLYGAAEAFGRCAASLRRHTDFGRHGLVLVADGPQPAATQERLAELAAAPEVRATVLRQPERRGFVAAVNRGMAQSSRDVVLLNSDTQVTAGWLEGLQAAAGSAPEVATATPFSNDATICSLPRWLERNALPAGWDADRFAELIARVSRREYPRLPTGVGVCLYLKRAALAAVGPFDEAAFGLGYGEESEWCRRAGRAGWTHVLADATFVYHEGQGSFGAERGRRVRAAHGALRRRDPAYLRDVARFIRADPLRAARERVVAALRPERRAAPVAGAPASVVHVVHGWPPWSHAGTELYAAWLARRQAAWREVAVYARLADPRRERGEAVELLDRGARVRLAVNNFTQRDPLSRNALRDRFFERDFARLLAEQRADLVHVHHLAGHGASLVAVAARRGLPIVYQLQDWWAACARANLLDRERRLCSGPGLGKCSWCLPLTRRRPAALWNRLLYLERRRRLRGALERADRIVAGSRAVVDSHRALGWLPAGIPVDVLAYGVEVEATLAPDRERADDGALVLGFIGSLLPHKGAHVAAAALSGLDPARVRLDVWGDAAADPAYAAEVAAAAGPGRLRLRGVFPEEATARVLGSIDVLVVPSLGLESYGLVAREALAYGVPVLASRRGALAELFADGGGGALFDPARPAELRGWIERLLADPGLLARWRATRPPIARAADHAVQIERIYAEILAGRRR